MKRAVVAVLFLLTLLGCGGGTSGNTGSAGSTNPTVTPGNPPGMSGNYDIVLISQVNPKQFIFELGGSMVSDAAGHFTGIMHIVNLPSCFATGTPVTLSGTIDGNGLLSFTSEPINNQVITGSATVATSGASLNGTYSIAGGCATGDHGTFGGGHVFPITDTYNVTWSISSPSNFTVTFTGPLTQTGPDANGVFHISGTLSSSGVTNCPAVNIQTSQVMGDLVSFSGVFINDPSNSTLNFVGGISLGSNPNAAPFGGQMSSAVGNPANAGANGCGNLSGLASFSPQ